MKRNMLLALAILVPVIIAGCITTGTIVIVEYVDGFTSSNQFIDHRDVNLNENSDYEENKDKLKSVDAITLTGYIINHGFSDVSAEVYMSDDSTLTDPDSIMAEATLIMVSPTVPAGDTLFLSWADGMTYMRNLAVIENELKTDGVFSLYGIASGPFSLEYDFNIIITITAGL